MSNMFDPAVLGAAEEMEYVIVNPHASDSGNDSSDIIFNLLSSSSLTTIISRPSDPLLQDVVDLDMDPYNRAISHVTKFVQHLKDMNSHVLSDAKKSIEGNLELLDEKEAHRSNMEKSLAKAIHDLEEFTSRDDQNQGITQAEIDALRKEINDMKFAEFHRKCESLDAAIKETVASQVMMQERVDIDSESNANVAVLVEHATQVVNDLIELYLLHQSEEEYDAATKSQFADIISNFNDYLKNVQEFSRFADTMNEYVNEIFATARENLGQNMPQNEVLVFASQSLASKIEGYIQNNLEYSQMLYSGLENVAASFRAELTELEQKGIDVVSNESIRYKEDELKDLEAKLLSNEPEEVKRSLEAKKEMREARLRVLSEEIEALSEKIKQDEATESVANILKASKLDAPELRLHTYDNYDFGRETYAISTLRSHIAGSISSLVGRAIATETINEMLDLVSKDTMLASRAPLVLQAYTYRAKLEQIEEQQFGLKTAIETIESLISGKLQEIATALGTKGLNEQAVEFYAFNARSLELLLPKLRTIANSYSDMKSKLDTRHAELEGAVDKADAKLLAFDQSSQYMDVLTMINQSNAKVQAHFDVHSDLLGELSELISAQQSQSASAISSRPSSMIQHEAANYQPAYLKHFDEADLGGAAFDNVSSVLDVQLDGNSLRRGDDSTLGSLASLAAEEGGNNLGSELAEALQLVPESLHAAISNVVLGTQDIKSAVTLINAVSQAATAEPQVFVALAQAVDASEDSQSMIEGLSSGLNGIIIAANHGVTTRIPVSPLVDFEGADARLSPEPAVYEGEEENYTFEAPIASSPAQSSRSLVQGGVLHEMQLDISEIDDVLSGAREDAEIVETSSVSSRKDDILGHSFGRDIAIDSDMSVSSIAPSITSDAMVNPLRSGVQADETDLDYTADDIAANSLSAVSKSRASLGSHSDLREEGGSTESDSLDLSPKSKVADLPTKNSPEDQAHNFLATVFGSFIKARSHVSGGLSVGSGSKVDELSSHSSGVTSDGSSALGSSRDLGVKSGNLTTHSLKSPYPGQDFSDDMLSGEFTAKSFIKHVRSNSVVFSKDALTAMKEALESVPSTTIPAGGSNGEEYDSFSDTPIKVARAKKYIVRDTSFDEGFDGDRSSVGEMSRRTSGDSLGIPSPLAKTFGDASLHDVMAAAKAVNIAKLDESGFSAGSNGSAPSTPSKYNTDSYNASALDGRKYKGYGPLDTALAAIRRFTNNNVMVS